MATEAERAEMQALHDRFVDEWTLRAQRLREGAAFFADNRPDIAAGMLRQAEDQADWEAYRGARLEPRTIIE